jgi:hypothetical protein
VGEEMKKIKKVSKIEKQEEEKKTKKVKKVAKVIEQEAKPEKKVKKVMKQVKEEKALEELHKTKKVKKVAKTGITNNDSIVKNHREKFMKKEVSKIEKTKDVIDGHKQSHPMCDIMPEIDKLVLTMGIREYKLKKIDGHKFFDNEDILKKLPPELQGRKKESKMFKLDVQILTKEEFEEDNEWIPKCEYMYTLKFFDSIVEEAKYYGNYHKKPCGVYFQRPGVARICLKDI